MSDYQAPEVKAELAAEAAAKAAEVVEETIDGVVEVVEVVRNNPMALAVVGFAALSIGAVGGYLFAGKKLKAMYEELADEQIAEAKQFYADLYKVNEDGSPRSPMDILEERNPEAAEALRSYQGEEFIPADRPKTAEEIDEEDRLLAGAEVRAMQNGKKAAEREAAVVIEETVVNVFTDDTFDLAEEMKHRTEDAPYIIHHDEFFAGDKNYETASYTWFETDNVLVDERDQPITEVEKMVGDDHLSRFGSGSKDPNIVYVRNDRLGIDFEISKSEGSYLENVLGIPKDEAGGNTLRHSNRNAQLSRRREFRHGDG
jgi:hypothetical protein